MSTQNGKSRQRIVRVPIPDDDWLLEKTKQAQTKHPDARLGVTTGINNLIRKACENGQDPFEP